MRSRDRFWVSSSVIYEKGMKIKRRQNCFWGSRLIFAGSGRVVGRFVERERERERGQLLVKASSHRCAHGILLLWLV